MKPYRDALDTRLHRLTKESQLIEGEPTVGTSFDNHYRAALLARMAAQEGLLVHPRMFHLLVYEDLGKLPSTPGEPLCHQRPGEYRSVEAYVIDRSGCKHFFAPAAQVPGLMAAWWDALVDEHEKGDLSDPETRWSFHAEFEAIHPFVDGNGRVGRCSWWNTALFVVDDRGADTAIESPTYDIRYAYYERLETWREARGSHPFTGALA